MLFSPMSILTLVLVIFPLAVVGFAARLTSDDIDTKNRLRVVVLLL